MGEGAWVGGDGEGVGVDEGKIGRLEVGDWVLDVRWKGLGGRKRRTERGYVVVLDQ